VFPRIDTTQCKLHSILRLRRSSPVKEFKEDSFKPSRMTQSPEKLEEMRSTSTFVFGGGREAGGVADGTQWRELSK